MCVYFIVALFDCVEVVSPCTADLVYDIESTSKMYSLNNPFIIYGGAYHH